MKITKRIKIEVVDFNRSIQLRLGRQKQYRFLKILQTDIPRNLCGADIPARDETSLQIANEFCGCL